MPVKSRVSEGIVYTEITGEIDFDVVLQQCDFIASLKDEVKNHYELRPDKGDRNQPFRR